jgi:hypothetical protein
VERDLQNQSILQMGALVANPGFGIDPEKWFEEMCRAQRLDPKKFTMDEEKKAQLAQQPPPVAPQIEAAKIRAGIEMEKLKANMQQSQAELTVEQQIAQLENQTMQTRIKVDTDRDLALVNAQHEKNVNDANLRLQELQLKKEIELLKYATQQNISLEETKTALARDAMKLRVQKELAGVTQVLKPPTEPPGRAPNGQAFQR